MDIVAQLETKAGVPGDALVTHGEMMRAIAQFTEANDERLASVKRGGDVLLEEKVARLNDVVGTHQRQLDDINLKSARPPLGAERKGVLAHEAREHKAAFDEYVRKGESAGLRAVETKAMSVGSNPDGGYTVPFEIEKVIGERLTAISPIRKIAGVREISGNVYKKPFMTAGPAVGWVGETDARCVVIAGTQGMFSSGYDIGDIPDDVFTDEAEKLVAHPFTTALDALDAFDRPTVAACAGHTIGGGLELALACDGRVAGTSATFGLPEVGRDLLPTWGGHFRLARVVGLGRAKELVLLGRRLDADGALTAGLVTEVVADGAARERALALAEAAVANAGRATLARAKALVTAGYSADARTAALLDVLAEAGQA